MLLSLNHVCWGRLFCRIRRRERRLGRHHTWDGIGGVVTCDYASIKLAHVRHVPTVVSCLIVWALLHAVSLQI